MANKVGEDPHETLAKIKLWIEIMYRLSIGDGIHGTDTIANVPISVAGPSATYTLKSIMNPSSPPVETQTMKYLLTRDTKCMFLDLGRRALGSALHTIQDSYAHGHCRRTLLNPGDLQPGGASTLTFKQGTYGHFGAVENFHSYTMHDHDEHDSFDAFDKDKMHINDPASFNPLAGARDAIAKCTKLINFWVAKTPYQDGPKALVENEIFALSPSVTPADNSVV